MTLYPAGTVTLTLFTWTCELATTIPPYPFAPIQGTIGVSSGARGQLAVGG